MVLYEVHVGWASSTLECCEDFSEGRMCFPLYWTCDVPPDAADRSIARVNLQGSLGQNSREMS